MSTPTSPTPWSTETSGGLPLDIHDQNGLLVARVLPLPLAGEEIAKRIVACVNALAGLPQECLDGGWTGAGLSAHAKRMEQRCADLLAQRDELLEALEDSIQYLQHHLPSEQLAPHRAAIAKARGEA